MHDRQTTHQLLVLRAALDALAGLGDDAPDLDRLRATLQALDPALSGDAFAPPAWVLSTGLPSPRWLALVTARREKLLLEAEADPPDEQIVRAAAIDADLAQRLIAARTFRRHLRRHATFPPPAPAVVEREDGPWWEWDHVLADGRWGRLRVQGRQERRRGDEDRWFTLPFDDLQAEVGYDAVRRCILGPAWRDRAGHVAGLHAVHEASGEATGHRLALDRMCAEDADAPGAVVVPIAVPEA